MPVNNKIRVRTFIFFMLAALIVTAAWPHNSSFSELSGSFIIVVSCFLVLYYFLAHFSPEVLKVSLKTMFILSVIVCFVILTRLALDYTEMNLLPLVPFALVSVVVRTFYDGRLAFFILLITVSLTAFFVSDSFMFAFMHIITGLAAVFTLTNTHGKGKFLFTALIVAASYSVLHTAFMLLSSGSGSLTAVQYLAFAGNATLVLLCYPVIYIFEKRFMFLSDTTLLELADTNQPLLRKLADEAPGSFQHSLQVANLAEEAARQAGANPLLTRAGAMYHDIGKISGPDYFVENQKNGVSPHDTLEPEASARMIISHVTSGVILARNFKLPAQLIDFITSHHGTSVTYYFYKKFIEKYPRNTLEEKVFSYPGPKPSTKETAIVMMADAVEASSRSLETQDDESISELVERIILLQEQAGQYSNVPFTFRDISDIKKVFKRRLSTMYHGRIAYPDSKAAT